MNTHTVRLNCTLLIVVLVSFVISCTPTRPIELSGDWELISLTEFTSISKNKRKSETVTKYGDNEIIYSFPTDSNMTIQYNYKAAQPTLYKIELVGDKLICDLDLTEAEFHFKDTELLPPTEPFVYTVTLDNSRNELTLQAKRSYKNNYATNSIYILNKKNAHKNKI